MDIFSKVWFFWKDWTFSFKNEIQHHSNNCHGWPYSTPFDQPNFPVHFRLFVLQSHGNFDFVFQGLNRLWMVSVTLILNGSPQKIVQWGQITAQRRPIDIRISADYSIFENGSQKIDCYVGCVASGPVLLKPNVVHVILFNFWKQKFVEHSTAMVAIDRNGGSLLIFEEKWPNDATVPKPAPNSHSLCVDRLLNDDVWIFWAPNATILLIDLIDLLPKQSKMY